MTAARKLVAYSEFRKELAVFKEDYGSIVVDCSTPKGMKSAKDCRKEIRDARSNLEDARKEAKAPILAKGTQIDDEAKDIKGQLDELYSKFDGAIKAIENKKEIDAAKALKVQEDKINELEQREQAIHDKEIELGIREPDQEPADSDTGSVDNESDSDSDGGHVPDSDSDTSDSGSADVETICEPHIKVAGTRLAALKKIRNLVEETDPQPEGEIDDDIATKHDDVLAKVWEIVDEFQ
jgi:hypothetical protein